MTETEWFAQAERDMDQIADVVRAYHPVNRQVATRPGDQVTAHGAERACQEARDHVRRNFEGDPVAQFKEAIQERNFPFAFSILNGTWFGVPESTSCWQIPGYRELVDLLEDPPEGEAG